MTMITHFLRFADLAEAQSALGTGMWCSSGDCWYTDKIDGGFLVFKPDGQTPGSNPTPVSGYHVNIGLDALSPIIAALPQFLGAMDESGALVAGAGPTWPKRVFSGTTVTQSSHLTTAGLNPVTTTAGDQITTVL